MSSVRLSDVELKKYHQLVKKKEFLVALALFFVIAVSYWLYVSSLSKGLVVGSFEANYYFEDDGKEPGKGTDGSNPIISAEHRLTETVKRPSINYSWSKFHDIDAYNFYGTWEGEIDVPEDGHAFNVNFDVSWSDVQFYVNGELISEWENSQKSIPMELAKGTHKVNIELHNHWHTAGFNVSFTDYIRLDDRSELRSIASTDFEATEALYAGVYEASSSGPDDVYNEIRLTLPETSSGLVLYLGSYHAINWVISNPGEVEIVGVILSSYAPGSTISTFSGVSDFPVYELPHFSGNYKSSVGFESLIGKEFDYVFTDYSTSAVVY